MELQMLNIDHSFGQNHVLHDLDFKVGSGQIHALLGENGAGKSTLMNILGGVLQQDQGQIFLDGMLVDIRSPHDAHAASIGFVHQELSLINDLPVYLNLFLGDFWLTPRGLVDHQGMKKEAQEILTELELDIDPEAMVSDLSPAQKQFIEIVREYFRDCRLLILDEPTSSLSELGIVRFFELIRRLRDNGVTIIFISHKLNEVMELCDHYTVLRNGHIITSGKTSETSATELAYHMVGHELGTDIHQYEDRESEPVLLELRHFTDEDGAFEDVNLRLHEGEILGVTGLLGDGRSEVFQAVFGDRAVADGKMFYGGEEWMPRSTTEAVAQGLAYLPSDRKENGIGEDLSIFLNATISVLDRYEQWGFLRMQDLQRDFDDMREKLHIRMQSPSDLITSLSGGNQQKVLLARWLMTNPRLLILDNPTQGVDVGVKEEIYRMLHRLRAQGLSIVVLTNEAEEIVRLCDRSYVMFHGKVVHCLKGSEVSNQNIMHWATGAGLTDGRLVND